MNQNKINPAILQERLINFTVLIDPIIKGIQNNSFGQNLKNQLARSATSPALNYAEAQFAESKKDFIHKMKIVLKELRETEVCLQIILKNNIYKDNANLNEVIRESSELIAIFVASLKTAQKTNNLSC
jgi:four helix bundle protein